MDDGTDGGMDGWMDGKLHFVTTSLLYKISFLIYFLPIGGQKAAVSDSVEGWCAAGILGASRVSIRMDDRTDGQRDDGMDGRWDRFRGSFISSRRPLIVSSIPSSVATVRPD